jgi:hypothetical protein
MTPRIAHITEDGIEKKRCCSCKEFKALDNYNACAKTWDNLRPTCKGCLSNERAANKEKMTEYNKQYWEKTKKEQLKRNKEWRENNKEHVKQKMKEWLEANKEHKKQKDKEYREANWENKKKTNNIWRKKDYQDLKTNPARVTEYQNYRVKSNVGRRIREMLKQNKSQRTMEYVGCSLEDLKKHLESKFEEGMTWENYGKYVFGNDQSGWHIDHIIPCNAFNFEDESERAACFFYANLQPLWGKENIIKHATFEESEKQQYINLYKSLNTNSSLS